MEAALVGGGSHGGVVRDSDDATHTRAPHAAATAAARVKHALVILGEQVPEDSTAVAAMRITHREVCLQALGQMMDTPMTKDAVAGQVRRLLVNRPGMS